MSEESEMMEVQEKGKKPVNISYIAHEADMARMERIVKRLWILLIISLAALIGTNVAWVVYEAQFQTVDVTQEVEQQADLDNIREKPDQIESGASYAPAPVMDIGERYIDYHRDTELSKLIDGKEALPVWEVMDELMQTLRLVFPQMYSSTMQKIKLKTQ